MQFTQTLEPQLFSLFDCVVRIVNHVNNERIKHNHFVHQDVTTTPLYIYVQESLNNLIIDVQAALYNMEVRRGGDKIALKCFAARG